MHTFFRRLFGYNGNSQEITKTTITAESVVEDSGRLEATTIIDVAPLNIEQEFTDYLLINIPESQNIDQEKTILHALERFDKSEFSGSNLIPRVPSVLPQLLKSLRNENVSGNELVQHISKDVVLVAELIREVNSPYYSPAEKVFNLENAIQILGQNGLRLLVARVAFKPIISLQSGAYTKCLAPKIWDHSEKTGYAGKVLSQNQKLDPFPAFLAGMLFNVGLIVAFRIVDRVGNNTFPRSQEFVQQFLMYAHQFTQRIGQEWEFPDTVVSAIRNVHLSQTEASALSQTIKLADKISKLRILYDHKLLPEDFQQHLSEIHDETAAVFNALKSI